MNYRGGGAFVPAVRTMHISLHLCLSPHLSLSHPGGEMEEGGGGGINGCASEKLLRKVGSVFPITLVGFRAMGAEIVMNVCVCVYA